MNIAKSFSFACLLAGFFCTQALSANPPPGLPPVGKDGRVLNLNFEDGTLKDWTATGKAFDRQPVRGDVVAKRRGDMKSDHQGDYWIGTYEVHGDDAEGTLTSVPFKVTHPWASFLVAGGPWPNTRVEVVRADTKDVLFKTSGAESETLRPVAVDLQAHRGKEIFVRVIDQQTGHWGHINFDNFVFHAAKPEFPNALNPAAVDLPPPADVVPFAGLSADQAAREITLPPGFSAHLFAGEPDIRQPIAFCLDDRGRVWVAEGHTYPRRRSHPPEDTRPAGADRTQATPEQLKDIFGGLDRILVFEDTNGDHTFDKRTVFLENVNLISGLEIGFGGLWIGAAPYLMFVPINDWDHPKPAGDPRILLDGWDYKADTHETLNTFAWGPDGWLYGCHGVFCPSNVGKPGAPESERQWMDAGVWRYHPTRHVFEVFTEGGSNPWGIDFDENGHLFAEMCVIPHFWHMIHGARIQRQGGEHFSVGREEIARNERHRHPASRKPIHPYIFDDIKTHGDHVHYAGNKGPHAGNARSDAAGGGHAHAGLMVYLGESWPQEYRGHIFMGNIHGQRLNVDIPVARGSGYVGVHAPDFLNFNDTWSQTLNQLYDQDGSVYIIDWYDKNQCHHNQEDGHDRSNGRIFKIVYNNQKGSRVDLQKLSDAELVALVPSKNEWMSRHARRILQERAAKMPDARKLAEAIARIATPDTAARLRQLWALHMVGGTDEARLTSALKSTDEQVRAWAIQLTMEEGAISAGQLRLLKQLAARESSPVVRLYITSALQRLPLQERWEILTSLNARGEDASDHNIPLMVWYAMEPLAAENPERALAMAVESKLPNILNFTTRRVAAIGTPEAYAAITRQLSELGNEQQQREMLLGLSNAIRGQRSVAMPRGWDAVETKLTASRSSEVQALTQAISLKFGSEKALASLRQTLSNSSADLGVRRTALDSLLSVRDPNLPPILQKLVREPGLRGQALRGLASYDDPHTPAAILAVYGNLAGGEKRDALNTLTSRPAYAKPLLNAIDNGSVTVQDLSADLIRQLRTLKDTEVETLLTKVYGEVRESSADKQAEIERYKKIYRAGGSQPGDAIRGRVVYARACQQCHSLFDVGGSVGPDLTGSARTDLDYILQNMVDPNAVIPNEYRTSTVETKDGRSLTGIVKRQDANSLTIATANETITLPRDEIDSVEQSELSMMPEGLLEGLSDQDVRDLIYYLGRPGQVPLLATSETVPYFFNGRDLAGWDGNLDLWRVENGELIGHSATGLQHNEFLKSQMVLTDFRLVCQVKLTPNKENSGIQFRSEPLPNGEVRGYQADIGAGWWGKLYEEEGRGLIWSKSGEEHVKVNDWNKYEIVAVGSRIRTYINGKLCVDLNDPQGAKAGIVALQLHSGGPMEIRFKDFELELNPQVDVATAQ